LEPEEKTGEIKVVFEPDGISTEMARGRTVLEIAQQAKVDIYSPCGGQGLCGRCAVRIEGDFERLAPPPPHIDREMGFVLACKSQPTGDVIVTIPPGSRTDAAQILEEHREGIVELSPIVHKLYLELPEPTVSDNICDIMRITRGIGLGLQELRAPLTLVREVGGILRDADWQVTRGASTSSRGPSGAPSVRSSMSSSRRQGCPGRTS
jgi:uncharacterized 2Fe-2S/4Fe-4S cluster protein (DUF4445 family)